jgi:YidC/Oxa1 family membrane protein insertase
MLGLLLASPLAPLEHVLRHVLDWLHATVGLPWAWAIVALTVIVRMLLVPLTVRQIHSMQALQMHAPEMKEIQRKYKGDRQRMNEELMKFYKENHINPAASCLPMIAQLPVFFALYFVLKNFSHCANASAHCANAPTGSLSWLGFVPNIAAPANSHWSGYVLLATYAASQVFSTYFMSQAMDKLQRRLMMVLPLIFITVIARFPVGLVIYWVTTNLWTVGQGLVTRRLVPKTAAAPATPRRSSRTPSPAVVEDSAENGAKTAPEPVSAPQPAAPKQRRPSTQPRRVKRNRGHGRR